MRSSVESLGLRTLEGVSEVGRFGRFVAATLRSGLVPPVRLRLVLDELFDVGILSLPIVLFSGVTVGAVLGLQGFNVLSQFGVKGQLGAVVGHSLIRELGPVLSALLVIGRAGSAKAAEIAAMVTTEQLDGLRMMSIDPIDFVVRPKALALLFAMPLLSALFVVAALLGGYAVGVELLGVDGGRFLTSLESSITFEDHVAQSLVKSVVFGALAGAIATWRGYTSAPTAAGVSAATTGTVVVASVAVLASDYAITALWGV